MHTTRRIYGVDTTLQTHTEMRREFCEILRFAGCLRTNRERDLCPRNFGTKCGKTVSRSGST